MVADLPVLTSEDVARILGVKPRTVRQYLSDSRPGGRYASHPFPSPAGRIGRWPYWLPEQAAEIREWDAGRAGQGVGGGRPRKTTKTT